MENKKYTVLFQGEIIQGKSREDVITGLSQIFRKEPSTIASMFTGKRIVIKRKVDQQTARKYKNAFQKAGAICHIEVAKDSSHSKQVTLEEAQEKLSLHTKKKSESLSEFLSAIPRKPGDKSKAEDLMEGVKRILPERTSAYQPSGKTTVGAVLLMIFGSIPAGALGVGAGWLLTIWNLKFSKWIIKTFSPLSSISALMSAFVSVMSFLGGLLITFAAVAWITGGIIVALGQKGNNRNSTIPAVLSFLVIISASVVLGISDAALNIGASSSSTTEKAIVWAIWVVYFGIGGTSAASVSKKLVTKQKYCEKTGKFLQVYSSKEYPLLDAPVFCYCIEKNEINLLNQYAKGITPAKTSDSHFIVHVYKLPSTRFYEGYIEIEVKLSFQYLDDGDKKTLTKSWLVSSIMSDPSQIKNVEKALNIS